CTSFGAAGAHRNGHIDVVQDLHAHGITFDGKTTSSECFLFRGLFDKNSSLTFEFVTNTHDGTQRKRRKSQRNRLKRGTNPATSYQTFHKRKIPADYIAGGIIHHLPRE